MEDYLLAERVKGELFCEKVGVLGIENSGEILKKIGIFQVFFWF